MGTFLALALCGASLYIGYVVAGNVHRIIKKKREEKNQNDNV